MKTDASVAHRDSSAAPDTDRSFAKAGYPLTPGVSALPLRDDFALSGYIQAQYESHQDSVDQLRQGGALLNQNRFLLRRGRFKVSRDWNFVQVILELDGNTARGPAVRMQKAEASLIYGRSTDKDQPPIAQLTLGIFDLPFGFEMTYTSRARWFMERTTASRAFFPGEPDAGLRLSGGVGFTRYSLSITNGEPVDEKSGLGLQDPNRNKDITGRFGAESKLGERFVIAGGVSFNQGRGFHAGTDATKSSIGWQDINENGVVDTNETVGKTGAAATSSSNFARWAMGADLEVLLKTRLGWTMVHGELYAASNLDRGLFVADPVLNGGAAIREFGWYAAFTQEITRYAVVGFRFDYYDPNADLLDTRKGKLLPISAAMKTYSPMFGLVLPDHARLLFQWDIVRDRLARDTRGVPTDFRNNQWTLRLQGML